MLGEILLMHLLSISLNGTRLVQNNVNVHCTKYQVKQSASLCWVLKYDYLMKCILKRK